ncbi:hypothetical protein BU26DRAFT_570026 [Trematosphaeria pertusa]|uniref:HD/PDEase domain-containing protein n=1 Tax=Trematosphaeria pertusa TaxID=390896 RepID=A0A6A6HZ78_9PLEO|nr:uncharacterized protein BU26DRAFT_570026 [Trematosphaeria pertusa]KAF2243326.1 hypothetical protein BU26DRAFT_570026 [Trematosphaeria pertusa]
MLNRVSNSLKQLPDVWASTAPISSKNGPLSPDPSLPGGFSNCTKYRSQKLFDMNKLRIPEAQRPMFRAVNEAVRDYMYGDHLDPSHDYEHIQRVVNNAHKILQSERIVRPAWTARIDPVVVYLAAMVHDVGEPKYLQKGQTQYDEVENLLKSCGVWTPIRRKVSYIVPLVSFTNEAKHEEEVKGLAEDYPELAVVQDADRLDGIGMIGQGRCFVYGGANQYRREHTIHMAVQLQWSRFYKYLDFMKTPTGKKEAEKRLGRMARFRLEWNEETDVSSVL